MIVRGPSSWSLILLARVLLVLLALGAVLLAVAIHRRSASASTSASLYVCPMHPEVSSPTPGDCPICRMRLEPKLTKAAQPALAAAVLDEPEPTQLHTASHAELRRFDAVSRVKPYDLSLEMRAPAWAESAEVVVALLHLDESELLASGESGTFTSLTRPKDGALPGVRVELAPDPPQPWDGATTLRRFHVDGAELTPGQTGSLKLATRIRHGLVVRESAILHSPEGPYVLVASADKRTFSKRAVVIGNVIYGYAAVIGGIQEDEYVAATHTFVLDSERRRLSGEAL